jgi:outer membrane protein assembly factor BamB
MRKLGLLVLVAMLVSILGLSSVASAAISFADPNFKQLWERADKILTERTGVGRGFIWGPEMFSGREIYTEAFGEQRLVQYFDKGRMEVTFSNGNRADYNFVTSGLLVKELVLGRQQNGNNVNNYTQGLPSEVQIAGDPNTDGRNPNAPTYRSFRNVTTFNNDNSADPRLGQQIVQRLDKAGNIFTISSPDPNVKVSYYEPATRHNVADVFVNYGNTLATIWNGTDYVTGPLFFPNATYVFGLPIAEPYWIRAQVNGQEKDILVQLFERRVLTYTPSNDLNSRVEQGNVGAHYYRWRYLENLGFGSPTSGTPAPSPTATPTPSPSLPLDFSQARASYLKSGSIIQGANFNAANVVTYPTNSNFINSSPVYDPDKKLVIIGTNTSGVVAIDASNFSNPVQKWRFSAGSPRFSGPVTLYNNTVYIGGSDGKVYAIRETDGTQLWAATVTNELSGGVFTQVALDSDTLYCTAGDGRLYALNLSNGLAKWQASLNGVNLGNGPVIGLDNTLYVTGSDQKVYAFRRDGTQLNTWTPTALDGALNAMPAFGNGRLYVGTSNGTLYALNGNGTVQTQKTFTAGKAIFATPAVVTVNGAARVYVGTRDGRVYGVDANNVASVLWTFALSGAAEINSSPAIVDGFVYFGADDRRVYRVEAANPANSLILATANDLFDTNSPVVNSGYLFIAPRAGGNLLMIR